ncbi:unnamed protein product [Brassicogethes aeneus]|uniref:Uncharacterized protein n=1 Tax=Brassicogethes aeneus TaxID=1431903 RepID=A0A9P0FDR6_BRAAE|nr:unnamed protein product [Brassicogethes aeneus]
MCRCCQDCLETCYWHMVEKRFCFDESIALYEDPVRKEEKNNNMFDNRAFYDSVSVIAGRAIVTIDPLPPKKDQPIVVQPKRLKWHSTSSKSLIRSLSKSVPAIFVDKSNETSESSEDEKKVEIVEPAIPLEPSKAVSTPEVNQKPSLLDPNGLEQPTRKKSLRERRMSKSLYLKIDAIPKEVPIIRQQSMPKFYLDTPEDNQSDSTLCRAPSAILTSPVINNPNGYDLYSIVQIEKTKSFCAPSECAPVHKESNRYQQIKEKMKLRKSKSTINTASLSNINSNTSLPI